mmetsp:Transcript_2770/g.17256  ORF Transcript_2770/g.17256 Transcript_2770/m.17256 type:complete len:96 (+) Transcript_2770:236-523(+)
MERSAARVGTTNAVEDAVGRRRGDGERVAKLDQRIGWDGGRTKEKEGEPRADTTSKHTRTDLYHAGGVLKVQYLKKKANGPKCAQTGVSLHGVRS